MGAYNCLVRRPVHEHVFCIDNIARHEFLEIIDGIEKEICTKPTASPTDAPTTAPSREPTMEPTEMPTMKLWEKRPWFPVKYQWSSSSSSSNSSSSSSSSWSSSSSKSRVSSSVWYG